MAGQEKYTILYGRLSQEDTQKANKQDDSNSIQNQEWICQGGILHFNMVLKKQRGVNPFGLHNSAVQGKCQGCHKARRSRFLDAYPA